MNRRARTVLEFLSRNRIIRRRLPADFSAVPILVSPEAALGFWRPTLYSDLFDFAREFVADGAVSWDVGANVGLFSIAAAHRAGSKGSVIAIEADIWLAGLLRKSAALQPPSSSRIQVLPIAVSDSLGVSSFNIARQGRAANYLSKASGSSQTGGIRETVSSVTVTLDWLLEQGIPAPQILKIDVEGAEAYTLQGAERLLAEVQPIILCEVFDHSRDETTQILRRHGYTLFDWSNSLRVPIAHATSNTLAIPPGR